jgi:oligopeptide transport system ATP-binding protein
LVGESGCGKTVSALNSLIPNPPGRIIGGDIAFEGEDLLKADEAEIRDIRGHRIAMIFQEPMTSLNPVLTIGRQITESLELHLKMDRSSSTRRAIELMEMWAFPGEGPHPGLSPVLRRHAAVVMMPWPLCNPKLLWPMSLRPRWM